MKNKAHTKPGDKNNYALIYTLEPHPERLTKQQICERGNSAGACDAALLASIIYPPDGSWSVAFVGVDGRTATPLPDVEMFKVWTLLGDRLAHSDELTETQRAICSAYFETVKQVVLEQRANDPNDAYPQGLN